MHLINEQNLDRVIVFTRTKHRADRVAKVLHQAGIKSAAIHGDRSQSQRQSALDNLKSGRCRVLVATDVVARGIDIDDVSHVVNYDLPELAGRLRPPHRQDRTRGQERHGVSRSSPPRSTRSSATSRRRSAPCSRRTTPRASTTRITASCLTPSANRLPRSTSNRGLPGSGRKGRVGGGARRRQALRRLGLRRPEQLGGYG